VSEKRERGNFRLNADKFCLEMNSGIALEMNPFMFAASNVKRKMVKK
jgi:hypothetical protein